MITESTAVTVRQNLGEILNQVQYRHDSVVITKDGKRVAAIVDIELFEKIRNMREKFDALSLQIQQAFAAVPMKEGMAEIDRAVRLTRAEIKKERKNAQKKT